MHNSKLPNIQTVLLPTVSSYWSYNEHSDCSEPVINCNCALEDALTLSLS